MLGKTLTRYPYLWIFLGFLCAFLWGSASPVTKVAYEMFELASTDTASLLLFAGSRFFLAGLLTMIFGKAVLKVDLKLAAGDFSKVFLLGLLQTFLQYFFFNLGLARTSGSLGSLLSSLSGFVIVLLAPLFFKDDRLNKIKFVGLGLALLGLLVLQLGGGRLNFSFRGEGFVLISNLTNALGSLLSKVYSKKINPVTLSGYQLTCGGGILALLGLVLGGSLSARQTLAYLAFLYLALLSALAFAIWSILLKYYPASKVGMFSPFIPVTGTLLSGLILGENIFNFRFIFALLAICLGIFVINRDPNTCKAS